MVPDKLPNNKFFQGYRESFQGQISNLKKEINIEFQNLAVNELFSLIVFILHIIF